MEALLRLYALAAGLVGLYMLACFVVALLARRNDVADVAWGPGFLLIAVTTWLSGEWALDRRVMMTGLVALWALRLAIHIHGRHRGQEEDYRYRAWREQWRRSFYLRTFLQVFMLQGLFMLMVAAPIIVVNAAPLSGFVWLDGLGAAVWALGFIFESVGDWQLARFKRHPENRGRVLQTGLWQYSRHPNYFGEVTQWWGLWLIALSAPWGWAAIVGPLTITWLILRVSGIPMLENKAAENPEFREYQRRVSRFWPRPPRRTVPDG